MPLKRVAFNKKTTSALTKKTPRLNGIGSHYNSEESVKLGYPSTESISNLVHQQVALVMRTKNFQRDVALEMKRLDEPQEAMRAVDAEYVRMEDLKRAVNEIISRDSIQKVLDNNAKLFAEALLNLKTRLVAVEAKLETLQSRMSDVEQLVHKRHSSHIKQVVQTMMKELGQDSISAEFLPSPPPPPKRQSSGQPKSPANVLFKSPYAEDFRRLDFSEELPIQVEKNNPIKKLKHFKIPERKIPQTFRKISRNAARFPASESNLGAAAPPYIVGPNVSSASMSASLVTHRMKKQRNQSTAEQKLNETNYSFNKRSPFSNDVSETFPISIRQTNATVPIKNSRTMEYQPHKILQIKAYKSKRT